jgi:hypothetical protein
LFAREYHIRAKRAARQKLQGEQLDITFPRRGRPSRIRRLERAGQMRLGLGAPPKNIRIVQSVQNEPETLDSALQMTFPVRPYTDDELMAEFERLFPRDAC